MNTNIWRPRPDSNNYDRIELLLERGMEFIRMFIGNSLADGWTPPPVRFDRAKSRGNFPALPGGTPLVFKERALQLLYPLIAKEVEVLPLPCEGENLHIINVLKVVDCLDHSRSDIKRFPDGRVMLVARHVFRDGYLNDVNIFKIPEHVINRVYVSSKFKELVEESGLQGLIFDPIA